MRVARLVDQQFAALEANTAQHLHYEFEELGVVYRARKGKVSKVAGALVIVLTTTATYFAIFQYAHTGIKQAVEFTIGR